MKRTWIVPSLVTVLLVFLMTGLRAQSDGRAAYNKACVKCHGTEGKGDGPAAKVIKTPMGDLTSKAKMAQYSDDKLYKMISEGGQAIGKSKIMLPQKGKLSESEIKAVIAHIKTLQK
ncbi:MAG TPA: cytochrome c [Acidobacteriota bacterium]|jgi:cytochrome c553|nr:cytochrome c [Acidobacteriota bacterium]